MFVVVRAWAYLHRHWVDEWARDALAHDCCWETVTFLAYTLSGYPDASWTGGIFTVARLLRESPILVVGISVFGLLVLLGWYLLVMHALDTRAPTFRGKDV